MMIWLDISFPTPQENILFDDVLLSLAEQHNGPEVLRFWESPTPFVVLGRIGKVDDDIFLEAARRDKIPVLRRSSGGGTVLQGPGCLNFSVILSKETNPDIFDLKKSYQFILGKVIGALQTSGVEAAFKPISDLALKSNQKKFSGNAQKRGRKFILHHGTILYQFDLDQVPKYLRIPKDMPEYRNRRPHLDFVTNIPIEPQSFKKALRAQFGIREESTTLTDAQWETLNSLVRTKDVLV